MQDKCSASQTLPHGSPLPRDLKPVKANNYFKFKICTCMCIAIAVEICFQTYMYYVYIRIYQTIINYQVC